jgi:hypothetical protein
MERPASKGIERWSPGKELRDSLFLLALTASSLSAYIGLGVVAVRLFATAR